MLKLSLLCLVLEHRNAQTFSAWKQARWLIGRTCSPDQGALRCILSGTGAVPTDNVTLLSTKES
jgi:hypothetical protein